MRELLSNWDVVLIILAMLLLFSVLAFGVSLLVFFLASNFAPKVLATGAGVLMFAALLSTFFKALSN